MEFNLVEIKKNITKNKFIKNDNFKKIIQDYNSTLEITHDTIKNNFNKYDGLNDEYEDFEDFIDRDPLGEVYPIRFRNENISNGDIDSIEKKLNLSLPPSYKEFLKSNGLLIFGQKHEKPYSMISLNEIGRLSDIYYFGIDDLEKENPELKKLADNLIVFARGDETLQDCFHVCFNYHSLNKETEEVEVFLFDQSDWPRMFKCLDSTPANESSMDSYLRQATHEMLEFFFDG